MKRLSSLIYKLGEDRRREDSTRSNERAEAKRYLLGEDIPTKKRLLMLFKSNNLTNGVKRDLRGKFYKLLEHDGYDVTEHPREADEEGYYDFWY